MWKLVTRSLNQILFVDSIFNYFVKIIKLLEGINQSIGACDLGQLLLLRESGTMVPKIYLVLHISHTMISNYYDKAIWCVCFQNLNDYTNVLLLLPEIRFDFPTHQWQSNLLQIFRPHSKANKAIRDIWRCNTAHTIWWMLHHVHGGYKWDG